MEVGNIGSKGKNGIKCQDKSDDIEGKKCYGWDRVVIDWDKMSLVFRYIYLNILEYIILIKILNTRIRLKGECFFFA